MIYHVDAAARQGGDGSKERPFRRINDAAVLAKAGDEVLVEPGVYREWVNPAHGGTDEAHRVVYRSREPLAAVITGAEVIRHWTPYQGDVWMARVSNGLFGDYNPFTTIVFGDWYYGTERFHTGEIYLNGRAMYERKCLEEVLEPTVYQGSWEREFTTHCWYTRQDGDYTVLYANFQGKDPNRETVEINVRRNGFYPDKTGVNYITLSGFTVTKAATTWAPPTAYQEGMVGPHWAKGWIIEDCDISHSKCSGISLGKYLQPNNENKWTRTRTKDGTQTERDAICQAQLEGWTKENIGHHIVRRCNIHDCGQTGIVGHLGCVFSVIEDNHIHHINNKQDLNGAEIGGIKLHAAIDVIIRRNHFHHCTRGLWLDWQAQGTRVTQNLFHHNTPPEGTDIQGGLALGEDVFIEVSHGPTLLDNNVFLSECCIRMCTQGTAMVHNLIAGSFTYVGEGTNNGGRRLSTTRYTPYHVPHRTEVAGFMSILHGDARFYNNIYVQQPVKEHLRRYAADNGLEDRLHYTCGNAPYDGYPTYDAWYKQFDPAIIQKKSEKDMYYDHLPVYTGGNVFVNGAKPCDTEENFRVADAPVTLELREEEGRWRLETNLWDVLPAFEIGMIHTKTLGEAFEPEQRFEQPDGSPIRFDEDYWGEKRDTAPIAGPFASGGDAARALW